MQMGEISDGSEGGRMVMSRARTMAVASCIEY